MYVTDNHKPPLQIVAPLQFGTACIYAARWSMMGVDVTIRDGCDGSLDRWLCEMLQIKWQPGIAKEVLTYAL